MTDISIYSFKNESNQPTMSDRLRLMHQEHVAKKSELLMDILNNYLGYNPPITNEWDMVEQLKHTHMDRGIEPETRLVCEVNALTRDETYYYIHPTKGKRSLLIIKFPRLGSDSDVWKFEYHSAFLSKDKRCCNDN